MKSETINPPNIRRWKIKNPAGVFKLTAGEFSGYVRMPTDAEIIKIMKGLKGCEVRANARQLLIKIWLGGDRIIIDDEGYFDSLESQMIELIRAKEKQVLSGLRF